jgi:hypothetical protein
MAITATVKMNFKLVSSNTGIVLISTSEQCASLGMSMLLLLVFACHSMYKLEDLDQCVLSYGNASSETE